MKELITTDGKVVRVSDEDYENVAKYRWHSHPGNKTRYARLSTRPRNSPRPLMHQMILGHYNGIIDHIDRDGLNNTRENLRVTSRSVNALNSGISKNNTSGYRGVSRASNGGWATDLKVGSLRFRKAFKHKSEAIRYLKGLRAKYDPTHVEPS